MPARRRQRTVFHYKVDEILRPEDRDAYRAVAMDPRTTNESARGWLVQRGYALSLSAVARHRRRLIAADRQRQVELDKVTAFARFAETQHNRDDFAVAAEYQLQHLAFQHLLRLGERAGIDGRDDEQGRGDDRDDDRDPVTPTELLQLAKLVSKCVDLATARLVPSGKTSGCQNPGPPVPDDPAAREAALIDEIKDILDVGRQPTMPPQGLPPSPGTPGEGRGEGPSTPHGETDVR